MAVAGWALGTYKDEVWGTSRSTAVAITPLPSPHSIPESSTKDTLVGSKVAETKFFFLVFCSLRLWKLSGKL